MFIQREVIRKGISMSLNGTYKLDLPEHGMLSSLLIRIEGSEKTGYGQGVERWRIIDEMSKVTVLANASTIIKSLTCKQAQALAFYDQGVLPSAQWRNYATNTQFETMLVNFGRFMGDTQYGLDLSRFNNVELQLTNEATSADFTNLTVTITGIYLRDVPATQFGGYMRTEEWKRWTTVADETKYNDLPTAHKLRRIILQAIPDKDGNFLYETNMWNVMYDVDLSLDTGQIRVYKGGLDQLMFENLLDHGHHVLIGAWPYQTADYGVDISIGRVGGHVAGAGTQDGAVASAIATLETARGHGTLKPEVYTGDEPYNVIAFGSNPFHTAFFDFGLDGNPNNYLDPDARKTVKLDIKTRNSSSAADGTAAIVLDRFVPQ